MITSRHIEKIVAVITAAAVILCLLAAVFSNALEERFGGGIAQEYETALFDRSSVIKIDIQMDGEKWDEMLENAINEEYYQCDVVVNGTTFYNVGIRPKGNSSLSSIYSNDATDRYSFKLEFDKYIDGQTCFGLDKLVLNDNYSDATNMKEAVVFDMFRYLGADASLCNYADISVNGETWGVYLALEAVEESFMLRNYGATSGNLYKPDSENMNGGGAKEMNRNPDGEDTDFPAFDRTQAGEKSGFTLPEGEEFTMP
ncbi:MAG: CotH kinase family protein, partial [Acutalibacteraceae bacterium]